MDQVFEIVKKLPNKELQVRRIGEHRTLPCPKCGENVPGCYGVRTSPNKPIGQMGLGIPCPKCGTSTIEVSVTKRGESIKVKETGEEYDMFSRVKAAEDRAKAMIKAAAADKDDLSLLPELAEATAQYGDELKVANPKSDELWKPYELAVSSYCTLIESGRREFVEPLARLTLRCNNIAKYDLMQAMRHAYSLIERYRCDVPPALMALIGIESALLDLSFDRMFYDDVEKRMEEDMLSCIEDFESLCAYDRAEFPYVASDGWNYILNHRRRNGAKGASTAARKTIAAIRDARKDGAPEDRDQLIRMATCYRFIASDSEKTYRDMIKDTKCWSDPLFLAIADFTFAEHVYITITLDDEHVSSLRSPKVISEAVKRLDEAISIMEAKDDVKDWAYILPQSYLVRGVLAKNADDKKLACYYAMFFYMVGHVGRNHVFETLMAAATTEEFGSPLQKWAMGQLGTPS